MRYNLESGSSSSQSQDHFHVANGSEENASSLALLDPLADVGRRRAARRRVRRSCSFWGRVVFLGPLANRI